MGYRGKSKSSFFDPNKTTKRFDVIAQLKSDEDGEATKVAMIKQKALVSETFEEAFPLPPPPPPRPAASTGVRQRRALDGLDSYASTSDPLPPPPPRPVVMKRPHGAPPPSQMSEEQLAAYRTALL